MTLSKESLETASPSVNPLTNEISSQVSKSIHPTPLICQPHTLPRSTDPHSPLSLLSPTSFNNSNAISEKRRKDVLLGLESSKKSNKVYPETSHDSVQPDGDSGGRTGETSVYRIVSDPIKRRASQVIEASKAFFRRASTVVYPSHPKHLSDGSQHPLEATQNQSSHAIDVTELDFVNGDYLFYSRPNSARMSGRDIAITVENEEMMNSSSPKTLSPSEAKALIPSRPQELSESERNRVLKRPELRQNHEATQSYRPWFLWTISLIQVVVMLVELIINAQNTGQFIQTTPTFNVLLGPHTITLVQMGARYSPCIKPSILSSLYVYCPDGMKIPDTAKQRTLANRLASNNTICTWEEVCALGGFRGSQDPNQWYRFITAIFLHGGIVHLFLNLMVQLRTGASLERDFGAWRIAIIYFSSGILGFVFSGLFSDATPSTGCSGALYGLIACSFIDLIGNAKLVQNFKRTFASYFILIVISLFIGTLPQIDNFAHIGGFFTGIISGLVFLPRVPLSRGAAMRNLFMMIVCFCGLVLLYVFLFRGYYSGASGESQCRWCKYLNCIPGMPWCSAKWNGSF